MDYDYTSSCIRRFSILFFFDNNFRGKYQDTKLTLEHGEFQMTKFLKDYFQDYDLNKVDLIFY